MTHTATKAGAIQNLALAYKTHADLQDQLSDAAEALGRAKQRVVSDDALQHGTSRVVPIAPGEYVIVKRAGFREFQFDYGLTNVLGEAPDAEDAIR